MQLGHDVYVAALSPLPIILYIMAQSALFLILILILHDSDLMT